MFLCKELVEKENSLSSSAQSTNSLRINLLIVSSGSPSTEDRSHNDVGLRVFPPQHDNQPYHLHQDISGGGHVVDVITIQVKQTQNTQHRQDWSYLQTVYQDGTPVWTVLPPTPCWLTSRQPGLVTLSFTLIQSFRLLTTLCPRISILIFAVWLSKWLACL